MKFFRFPLRGEYEREPTTPICIICERRAKASLRRVLIPAPAIMRTNPCDDANELVEKAGRPLRPARNDGMHCLQTEYLRARIIMGNQAQPPVQYNRVERVAAFCSSGFSWSSSSNR